MDSPPKIEDILIKDEDFTDLLLFDEKDLNTGVGTAGQGGRKSNSLNDLVPRNSNNYTKKGPYKNVESKVKTYIASLPAPNSGTRRKTFKKHTSMPGYFVEGSGISHGHSEVSLGTCVKLEQEYNDYKRQSVHTISELQKQINVSVAMITTANNKNYELMDRIAQMHKDMQDQENNRPTPDTTQLPSKLLVCTPKKAELRGKKRMFMEDTAGSFIGQSSAAAHGATVATLVPVELNSRNDLTPEMIVGKRNLSFNSSGGDVTRRSGTTDSGINTSDENGIHIQETAAANEDDVDAEEDDDSGQYRDRKKQAGKRKRVKRLLASLICCVGGAQSKTAKMPKITYKKM